jgi:hypothetical protein
LTESTAEFDAEAPTLTPREPVTTEIGKAPDKVGGYRLLHPLGQGGMGTVYEAEEISSCRRVALKLLSPEFSLSDSAVERFRQEGRLASTIAHPRCVFVLAADEDAGRPYIVMELMCGESLQDLVRKNGPLRAQEAIAKILDVIEGLQEAHRLGVIHRDVKPSNCFLEADGRVKVGDFGLAKSLLAETHLTKTGTFLGTVQFASPEQIRHDPLDQQTDVYSVAATLYYLIAGRAPFQEGDAAATLARIVSDSAPSIRIFRPEIPTGLDKVILRGLERQRERRWRTLEEFRSALLPFVPGQLSIGSMGIRAAAFAIDYFVLAVPLSFVVFVFFAWSASFQDPLQGLRPGSLLTGTVLWLLYFGASEAVWSCSVGKWLLRLRVVTQTGQTVSLSRTARRTVAFYCLLHMGSLLGAFVAFVYFPEISQSEIREKPLLMLLSLVPLAGFTVGVGLLLAPMRARNGYRGLHEFLSGTRVIRLRWPERQRSSWGHPSELPFTRTDALPAQIGAFQTQGIMRATDDESIILAADRVLGRKVWIWYRSKDKEALSGARRACTRPTRLRWLSCGTDKRAQWDAYVAPPGCSMCDLVAAEGKLQWVDARRLLAQVTEELAAASEDSTLPAFFGVQQLWVQPNGGVVLLDFVLKRPPQPKPPPSGQLSFQRKPAVAEYEPSAGHKAELAILDVMPAEAPTEAKGLLLLRQTATLLLEGQVRPAEAMEGRIRAPLPGYAAKLLRRLLSDAGYKRPEDFQADLLQSDEESNEINRARRAAYQAVAVAFLSPVLAWMLFASYATDFIGVIPYKILSWEEPTVEQLRTRAVVGFAACVSDWSLLGRLQAAIQGLDGIRLADELKRVIIHAEQEREARLRYSGWFDRHFVLAMENSFELQKDAIEAERAARPNSVIRDVRLRAQVTINSSNEFNEIRTRVFSFVAGFLACAPLVWAFWAFLFRGGLSYRIMGIALVRGDGRPASRLQCALRSLVVWAPPAALLILSLWLSVSYWSAWKPEPSHSAWMLWLSWLVWWCGVLLLIGYVALALWRPARGPHDRLVGTYLVPK